MSRKRSGEPKEIHSLNVREEVPFLLKTFRKIFKRIFKDCISVSYNIDVSDSNNRHF